MQPEASLRGWKYFISFVDDCSCYCCVYLIKEKSAVYNAFKNGLAIVERQTERKLQLLRLDNEGEYACKKMESNLPERGIAIQKSAPYSSHQNGVAERLNHMLLDIIRSMLYHKSVLKVFSTETLAVAAYIRNLVSYR